MSMAPMTARTAARPATAAARPATAVTAVLLAAGLLLAGCGSPGGSDPAADGAPEPDPVALLTELEPGDVEAVGEAANAFGFDLFGAVATGDENAVTSPLSASVLLAMVLAGAESDTAAAMARVLHLDDTRDVRVGELLEAVADTDDVSLSTANALWADEEVPFEADYVEFVRESFGASVENVDLGEPATADRIDGWVAEQTEGRIDEMAADLGLPDPEAALVLMNTVYFLGEWTTQFDPVDTLDQPFTLADGDEAEVPVMHLWEQELEYAERDGYELLRLPYGEDGRYGMEVLLPAPETRLAGLLRTVDAAEWGEAVASLEQRTVDEVALPRFQLEWGSSLNDALTQLGMRPALDPALADFTPMSSADLFLDEVVQKTFIQVDEEGTEAAAATGGSMGITSAEPELRFLVDRPFAFTISDTETGTILFLGAVADPRN